MTSWSPARPADFYNNNYRRYGQMDPVRTFRIGRRRRSGDSRTRLACCWQVLPCWHRACDMRSLAPRVVANVTGANKCQLIRPSNAAGVPTARVRLAAAANMLLAAPGISGAEPAQAVRRAARAVGADRSTRAPRGECCRTAGANPLVNLRSPQLSVQAVDSNAIESSIGRLCRLAKICRLFGLQLFFRAYRLISKKSKVAIVSVPIFGNDRSAHAISAGRLNAPDAIGRASRRIAFPHVGQAARNAGRARIACQGGFCDEPSLEGDACASGLHFDRHCRAIGTRAKPTQPNGNRSRWTEWSSSDCNAAAAAIYRANAPRSLSAYRNR